MSLSKRFSFLRGFIRRLFVEDTPAANNFKGLAWLFLGVANKDSLIFDEDWQQIKKEFPNNFRVDYALSREQKNKRGEKMYIQDKVEEYGDEIFERMEKGAHMYFCGLKGNLHSFYFDYFRNLSFLGMMPGILDMLSSVATKRGLEWSSVLKHWKEHGQWHVEVY